MFQTILVGLIAMAIGLIYCIFGYRLYRFLIPIWAFLFGFGLGAGFSEWAFGTGFLGTLVSWIVAIAVGLGFGALGYAFYSVGVTIAAASIGATFFAYLGLMFGLQSNVWVSLLALIGALLFAAMEYFLNLEQPFVIAILAAAGASGVVTGLLVWFGRLDLADLGTERFLQPVLTSSWLWLLVWAGVAVVSAFFQLRTSPPATLGPR